MHNVFSFVNEMLIPDMAMVAYVGKQLLGGLHFLQICNGYEYCCFCFLVLLYFLLTFNALFQCRLPEVSGGHYEEVLYVGIT